MDPISSTSATTQAFACPHDQNQQPQESVVYKVAACAVGGIDFGRFYYVINKECYMPDHDCTFNVIDKEVNAWSGKRERDRESFRRPDELHKEAQEFGEKKFKIDPELAKSICAIAQARKFINDNNDNLAASIDLEGVFKIE